MLARVARWTGYERGRANALDVGRGLAIVSVMYGHSLAPWFMAADGYFSESAFLQWKFGASFIMLFFFFLSGVSWRENRSLETTFRQAIALVLIAWLASVAFDLLHFVLSWAGAASAFELSPIGAIDFLKNAARSAVYGHSYAMSALWFLTALAVVRVLMAIASRMGAAAPIMLCVLLLGLTLASTEYGWRNFYQLNLIGYAFLAFLAGHASRAEVHKLERWPHAAFALMLLGGAVAIATFHLNEGCRWDWAARCSIPWLEDRFGVSMILGQIGNLPLFLITGIAGVAFALALSIMIARYCGKVGERMAIWGRSSLNLLIVNCLFLEMVTPVMGRWLAPAIPADNVVFFVMLFALTMAVNLIALGLLKRPLRELQSTATWGAGRIVELVRWPAAIVMARWHRVSQGHE